MAETLEHAAARSIWQSRMALDIPAKGRANCAKVQEGRRQAFALVASSLGANLAHAVPGFDLEAFKRELDPIG